MFALRRLAVALSLVTIAAGCSGSGAPVTPHPHGQLPAAVRAGNTRLRAVAGLTLTVTNGIASFTAVKKAPPFVATASEAVTVPAMDIDLCPALAHPWSSPCPSPSPSPTPQPMLRIVSVPALAGLNNPPKGTYYLAMQGPGSGRLALSGPGTLAGQIISFPASNALLELSAGHTYTFFVAVTQGVAPTPTPSPTPTPLANTCPSYAGTIAAVAPPASTPLPVLVSPPPVNFISNYQFSASPAPIYQFACGPAQLIYFGRNAGGTISTYDPASSSLQDVAQANGVPSTLTLAISAQDRLNNLYATAFGATQSVVYQVHYDGTTQASVSMPASFFNDVPMAEGSDGNVYGVGSTGTAALAFRLTPTLAITALPLPNGCARPFAITAGSDGNLWILDSGCGLVRLSTGGSAAIVAPQLGFTGAGFAATAFAQGPDGAFYAAVPGEIERADPAAGTVTAIALPTEAGSVQGLVAGSDHRLWISAVGGSQLGVMARLDLTTGAIVEWPTTEGYGNDSGGAPTNPAFLVTGPDGNIYGADRGIEHSVMKLQPALAGS